jgi:hypothetical protein
MNMTQITARPDYILPEVWVKRLSITSDILQAMDAYVAFVASASPEIQNDLLGFLVDMLERAGVAVPEVWRCSLEEMD